MEMQTKIQEDKKKKNFLNMDDIKKMLDLPDFHGVKVHEYPTADMKITCPPKLLDQTNDSKFDKIPEYLKSHRPVYSTNNHFGGGDTNQFPFSRNTKSLSSEYSEEQMAPYSYELQNHPESSACSMNMNDPICYDEYMKYKDFSEGLGKWRVTPQSTLSLTIDNNMQVDVTIDGAVRIINPKAYVAMAVNPKGTDAAIMHPMGRVLQEGPSAMLMAFDMQKKCHKFAKLWSHKAIFKSSNMNFAYIMDLGGTRTTMCAFPKIPSNDISLPVFYSSSYHGPLYRAQAQQSLYHATEGRDTNDVAVWTANGVTIKYQNGELRVMKPSGIFLRTNSVTGTVSATTAALHCTASQTINPHFFMRFEESKMHYNGHNFKLRTLGQAAGFDENNQITIY